MTRRLLHFGADRVRPQGRAAGGVAGIELASEAAAIWFGAVDPTGSNVVLTVAGKGRTGTSIKVTPFTEYPGKGRATGGVRCHRFLQEEDALVLGWVGQAPRAAAASGVARTLPEAIGRRDGSGSPLSTPIAAIAPGVLAAALPPGHDGRGVGRSDRDQSPVDRAADDHAVDDPSDVEAAAGPKTGTAAAGQSGLASDPARLFDVPQPTPRRPRPRVERDDYDPDSLDDIVQTGEE